MTAGTRTGISLSFTNGIEEMEERISGIKGMIGEMDTSVKENVKYKEILAQRIQEIWRSIKRSHLRRSSGRRGRNPSKGTHPHPDDTTNHVVADQGLG